MLSLKIFLAWFVVIFFSACSTVQSGNVTAAKYNADLGLQYMQRNNMVVAKQKLLLALKQAPNEPLVLDTFGYYLERTGNISLAKKYYLQALKIAPNSGAVLNNYGAYLCRHRKYRESLTYFAKAANDINYLQVAASYENAGRCALKIPDNKLAIKYLHLALKNNPTNKNVIQLLRAHQKRSK